MLSANSSRKNVTPYPRYMLLSSLLVYRYSPTYTLYERLKAILHHVLKERKNIIRASTLITVLVPVRNALMYRTLAFRYLLIITSAHNGIKSTAHDQNGLYKYRLEVARLLEALGGLPGRYPCENLKYAVRSVQFNERLRKSCIVLK